MRKPTFSCLAAMLFLLLLEGGIRLLAIGVSLPGLGEDPFFGFYGFRTVFERDPKAQGMVRVRDENVELYAMFAQSFPAEKPAGELRVACLGGSVTNSSYPGFLEEILEGEARDLRPDNTAVRVINAGVRGMGTTRLMFVLREVLAHDLDFIVISTGHNEGLEHNFYRSLLSRDRWVIEAQRFLYRSRLALLLRFALRRVRSRLAHEERSDVSPFYRDMNKKPFLLDEEDAGSESPAGDDRGPPRSLADNVFGVHVENYWRNLLSMGRMVRRRSVPMAFLELPTQVPVDSGTHVATWLHSGPRAQETFWRKVGARQGTPADVETLAFLLSMAQGLEALEGGDAAGALEHFHAARIAAPGSPRALYGIGRALSKLDREAESRAVLSRARSEFRAQSSRLIMNILLRAASHLVGVPFLEMSNAMDEAGEEMGDIFNRDLWIDHVHPSEYGYTVMAEAVAGLIQREPEREMAHSRLDSQEGWEAPVPEDRMARLVDALAVVVGVGDSARVAELLVDEDPIVRAGTAEILGGERQSHVSPLLERCWRSETDPWVKRAILRGLSHGCERSCESLLLEGTRDPSASVRAEACRSIGARGDAAYGPHLMERLSSEVDPRVRIEIIRTLGRLGHDQASSRLSAIVRERLGASSGRRPPRSPESDILIHALRALGELNDSAALSPIEEFLDDHDPRVVRAASWAAGKIVARTEAGSGGDSSRHKGNDARGLAERLSALGNHPSLTVRWSAARGLAAIGGEEVTRALIRSWPPATRAERGNLLASILTSAEGMDVATLFAEAESNPHPMLLQELARRLSREERWTDIDRRRVSRAALGRDYRLDFDVGRDGPLLRDTIGSGSPPGDSFWIPQSSMKDMAAERSRARLLDHLEGGRCQNEIRLWIETLGIHADRAAVPALARLLEEPRHPIFTRCEAAWALGRIGGEDWFVDAARAFEAGDAHLRLLILRSMLRSADRSRVLAALSRSRNRSDTSG